MASRDRIPPVTERASEQDIRPSTQETLRPVRNTRFDEDAIMRKPVPTQSSSRQWRGASEISPPTPGVDDTPYIHFAIDQLTRDEELTGRRRLRQGSEDSYAPITTTASTLPPVIPPKSEARLSRPGSPEPLYSGHQTPQRSRSRKDDANHTLVDLPAAAPNLHPQPLQSSPPDSRSSHSADTQALQPRPLQPRRHARPEANSNLTGGYRPPPPAAVVQPSEPTPLDPNDNLLFATPPPDAHQYPSLQYVPWSLRLPAISLLVLYCLALAALLIFCAAYSPRHDGLLDYDGVNTARYFLFEFFPQILSALAIYAIHILQAAVHRILPFTVLASEQPLQNANALRKMKTLPQNFLTPDLSFFQHGEPMLGVAFLIFWAALFAVPLQSSVFQTQYFASISQWRWVTVQPIIVILILLYISQVFALIILYYRFANRTTGLKNDPISISDIMAMAPHPSVPPLATDPSSAAYTESGSRLGYWRTSNQPNEVFYGLAPIPPAIWNDPPPAYTETQPSRLRSVLSFGKSRPMSADSHPRALLSPSRPNSTAYAPTIDLESQQPQPSSTFPSKPNTSLPWYLQRPTIFILLVLATALLITFLVLSFTNDNIKNGFAPLLPAQTNDKDGFSPANFLYSFLPSLIGVVLHRSWLPIDTWFRAAQPWANMNNDKGAKAEKSVLLDYNATAPGHVSLKALAQGDWKVAWTSLVSLLSAVLPVLGGGLFTAQIFGADDTGSGSGPSPNDGGSGSSASNGSAGQVREGADLPAFYIVAILVVIYALSFALIFPGKARSTLQGDFQTLGGIIQLLGGAQQGASSAPGTAATAAETPPKAMAAGKGSGEKSGALAGSRLHATPIPKFLSGSKRGEKGLTEEEITGTFVPFPLGSPRNGLHGIGRNHATRAELVTGLVAGVASGVWRIGESGCLERGEWVQGRVVEEGRMF